MSRPAPDGEARPKIKYRPSRPIDRVASFYRHDSPPKRNVFSPGGGGPPGRATVPVPRRIKSPRVLPSRIGGERNDRTIRRADGTRREIEGRHRTRGDDLRDHIRRRRPPARRSVLLEQYEGRQRRPRHRTDAARPVRPKGNLDVHLHPTRPVRGVKVIVAGWSNGQDAGLISRPSRFDSSPRYGSGNRPGWSGRAAADEPAGSNDPAGEARRRVPAAVADDSTGLRYSDTRTGDRGLRAAGRVGKRTAFRGYRTEEVCGKKNPDGSRCEVVVRSGWDSIVHLSTVHRETKSPDAPSLETGGDDWSDVVDADEEREGGEDAG